MSTYSQQQQRTAPQVWGRAERATQHHLARTIGVIVGAIVVGAFIGLLLAAAIEGPATAQIHRGGGHGRTALHQQMQRVAASSATQTQTQSTGEGTPAANSGAQRSHARGGFAVGRTFDVGGAAATTIGAGADSAQP